MAARVIDGKAVAAAVRERVKVDVAAYAEEAGRTPQLVTVIVGEDPASEIYVRMKHEACEALGMRSAHHGLEAATSQEDLLALVEGLAPTTTSTGSSESAAPRPPRSRRRGGGDRPGQGRRRADPGQRRPARPPARRA